MEKLRNLLVVVLGLVATLGNAQTDSFYLNNQTVSELVSEYIIEAKSRGLDVEQQLKDNVDYILVEVGSQLKEPSKRRLSGTNMTESNRDKKFIMLSESCLNDFYVLKGELFKELSFMLGVDYDTDQNTILSANRTDKYTHAYLSDKELSKAEFDYMFGKVKTAIN